MRRHNWLIYPPSRFDADPAFFWADPWAEESYTYDGLGGRISRVTSVIGTGEPAGSGTANANTRPVFLYDLEYDSLGNAVRRSYPSCTHRFCSSIPPAQRQRTVEQTFSQGLLASVPGYASSVSYHPNGLVDQVRHANGITWIEDNDPDDMARPARIRTSGAPSSEQRELDTGVYAYDAAGNVTRTGADRYAYDLLSRIADARLGLYVEPCGGDLTLAGVTEAVPRTWETCGTIHGGPDYTVASDVTLRAEGRVVFYDGFSVASGASLAVEAGAAVNDAPATPVERAQSYSYDRFGNLLSMTTTEAGGSSTTRTFATSSSTNRLSSSLVLYDTSGNVTARQIGAGVWWDFDHDPFNMLRTTMPTSTTGYEHLYGPGDERIGVIDWTGGQNGDPSAWIETYTLRDLDGRALRQYRVEGGNTEGNWSILRDYVWRGSSLLALETPSGVRHLHPDHLGSPRLITDATGATLAEHVYFPFGEEATPPSTIEVLKFTGHERDFLGTGTTDDLDYMHARYYSPHLGRFMSVDPSKQGWDPKQPQSWNRYAYVRGNPLKYVDPDGRVITPSLLGNPEGIDNLTPEQQQSVAIAAGVMAGLIAAPFAIEAGGALYAQLLLRPEVVLTAAQVVGGFADDHQSGGGPSSVRVFTKLTEAPQAGRVLSTAAGEGGRALAESARETGKLFAANLPKALLTKLEQAGLIERRLTMMNGKVAIEIRFSAKATEALAKYFREVPPE